MAASSPPRNPAATDTDGGAAETGPWPSYAKLAKANAEAHDALAKVALLNGDAPDLLPRIHAAGSAASAPAAGMKGAPEMQGAPAAVAPNGARQ